MEQLIFSSLLILGIIISITAVDGNNMVKENLNYQRSGSIDSCLDDQPKVAYLDAVGQWSPATSFARSMGVPGFAPDNDYNVFIYTFWLTKGVFDAASGFSQASTYLQNSVFGSTNDEIQQNVAKRFHDQGKIILVSAFGGSENPTTGGADPILTAQKLGQFVLDNNFDGVDLDWEDNKAMQSGIGEQWLIDCTIQLRKYLPVGKYILTHAPQAPYFTGNIRYINGGYLTINQQVGHLIDWYNIQFYNQQSNGYDSYETLFEQSGNYFPQTSIQEMIDAGVDPQKIVIGKPITEADATNTGWVDPRDLGTWAKDYYFQTGICFGVMTWQYIHDSQGLYPHYYKDSFDVQLNDNQKS